MNTGHERRKAIAATYAPHKSFLNHLGTIGSFKCSPKNIRQEYLESGVGEKNNPAICKELNDEF